MGITSGIAMDTKVLISLAPSIRADSYNSSGTLDWKYTLVTIMLYTLDAPMKISEYQRLTNCMDLITRYVGIKPPLKYMGLRK